MLPSSVPELIVLTQQSLDNTVFSLDSFFDVYAVRVTLVVLVVLLDLVGIGIALYDSWSMNRGPDLTKLIPQQRRPEDYSVPSKEKTL